MAISVMSPISQATDRAKLITFQPFNLGKWFVLGFCAFLGSLGEGGSGSYNFNPTGGMGTSSPTPPARRVPGVPRSRSVNPFEEMFSWISDHWLATVLTVAGILLIALAIALLILWISSRGKFMFIDCIARNVAEVIAPWKRFRRLANSLFFFHVYLTLIGLAVVLAIVGVCFLLAWSDIESRTFGSGAITSLVLGAALLIPIALLLAVVSWCTDSFVVPIMYARDATVAPAWREFRQNILAGHVGTLFLFLLMDILLSIVAGIAQILLGCLTLCIGLLPYLSSVVSLPVLIFLRAYPIYYLQQFGPQYVIIQEPPSNYGFPVVMPPQPWAGPGPM